MALAKASQTIGYEDLMRDIKQKVFKPVYLLMGSENYYIDQLCDAIINNVLTEDEKAFNLSSYYGMDAEIGNVINSARSYPMGAQYSVVVLREAQHMKNLENLSYYFQNPQPTTILIITYKNGVVDRRKKFVVAIQQQGVVFEAVKPKESLLPGMVINYLAQKGFSVDHKSASIIADSIGTDLSRLYGELDKLMIAMPEGQMVITPQIVESNIGISKDFNYFELQDALIRKDAFKAQQIAKYFDDNQKANPIQVVLPMLSRFFSVAMQAYYAPDQSERGLAQFLGMQDWQVRRNVIPVLQKYSGKKVLQILNEIRVVDGKSKGVEGSKVPSGDLLKELICFILH